MTDFTNFNPDKSFRTGITPNRQSGPPASGGGVEPQDVPTSADPYADLKMDPDRMMSLLSAQSRSNIQPKIAYPGIEKSIEDFVTQFPPERHAQHMTKVGQLLEAEFPNTAGSPDLLQELADDLLIGRPAIRKNPT